MRSNAMGEEGESRKEKSSKEDKGAHQVNVEWKPSSGTLCTIGAVKRGVLNFNNIPCHRRTSSRRGIESCWSRML